MWSIQGKLGALAFFVDCPLYISSMFSFPLQLGAHLVLVKGSISPEPTCIRSFVLLLFCCCFVFLISAHDLTSKSAETFILGKRTKDVYVLGP